MLKAIIVDDEAPARSELRFLLDELEQTEVVAEAASVREAIEKLKEYPQKYFPVNRRIPVLQRRNEKQPPDRIEDKETTDRKSVV